MILKNICFKTFQLFLKHLVLKKILPYIVYRNFEKKNKKYSIRPWKIFYKNLHLVL